MSGGKTWSVDTEQLSTTATTLGGKIDDYKAEYEKLYTELEALTGSDWKSAASEVLSKKLEEYRTVLSEVADTLTTFQTNLTTAKTNYENADEAVKNAASSL